LEIKKYTAYQGKCTAYNGKCTVHQGKCIAHQKRITHTKKNYSHKKRITCEISQMKYPSISALLIVIYLANLWAYGAASMQMHV